MLTVIILNNTENEAALFRTTNSLNSNNNQQLDIQEIIITEEEISSLNSILRETNNSYAMFLTAGDVLRFKSVDTFIQLLSNEEYGIIHTANYKQSKEIDLNSTINQVPLWLNGYIIRKDMLTETKATSKYGILFEVYKHLSSTGTIYATADISCESVFIPEDNNNPSSILQKSWYLDFAYDLLKQCTKLCEAKPNFQLPVYLQYALLTMIWHRFACNLNNGNKHVIDDEYPEFENIVANILKYINDDVIFNSTERVILNRKLKLYVKTFGYPSYSLPLHFVVSMLQLKHGEDYKLNYFRSKTKEFKDIWVQLGNNLVQKVSDLKCNLYLMDYDSTKNQLILEYHIDNFVDLRNLEVGVSLNGNQLPVEETYIYSHTKYFGHGVQRALTYRTTIQLDEEFEGNSSTLCWYVGIDGYNIPLKINAKKYCARVSSLVKKSYWRFGDYIVTLHHSKQKLIFTRANNKLHFKREVAFFHANYKGKHAIRFLAMRALYWIVYPWMKNKTIWLTYDKLYKGGDCGEYFYKYACTRKKETGITPVYVINGNSPDYHRLKKEGYKPLKYRSIKHYLYYLNSSVVFTTHGGVFNFNGLTNASIPYFQDLLRHDVACIQHGLTVQQLAHNSNRLFNNMKRYYCASKYEIENLSRPIYGYDDKSVLRLTGIPRYDGLVNKDKRQILITPTWRNYIAMPATKKNEAKPYYPGFKDTDYFKIYNSLLSDPKLIETANRTGYKLIYLLHPVISAQLEDYPKNDSVTIIPSLTVNYEKILTESSLMVTDYSGVQFDFAYMRKPIVYYHPPELPPHYKEGGFFYDTMGFGEICSKHQEIVDCLCEYMENNCSLKPFYRHRQDDFFAYEDRNSCKRIYDDMLEYQLEKGKSTC